MLMASDLSEAVLGTCETALIQLLCKNSYGLDAINDIRKKAPLQIVLKRIESLSMLIFHQLFF